jgi:hypothetical protein
MGEQLLHGLPRDRLDPRRRRRPHGGRGHVHHAGAVKVPFDAEIAQRQFAGRGKDFLTCRNFQFGASQFACPVEPF